jgi:hypothetical protein
MWVAEAFLSNKVDRTSHADDAAAILSRFWDVSPVPLQSGCEPLLSSIAGVPPVRVFRPNLGGAACNVNDGSSP